MKIMTMVLSLCVFVFGFHARAKLHVEIIPNAPQMSAPQAGSDTHISEFFGQVQLNMSEWRSWKISNTGDSDLEILDLQLTGVMYSGSTTCPKILSPQDFCQIDVRFSPFSEGYHTGNLDVIVNAGGNLYFDFWGYGVR